MPISRVMIGRRHMAILLLLAAGGMAIGACGDSSAPRSSATAPQTADQASQAPGTSSDEYPGVYGSAKEVCGSVPRERVAANVHSRSTAPKAIARAFASGYKPRLRARAYRGCLAALH